MKELFGKNVLFISPCFFGYEIEIKNKLESFGAQVRWFDDRPKNDFFTKFLIRLNISFISDLYINAYHKKIHQYASAHEIDFLFLVDVEGVGPKFIHRFKMLQPNAKIYIYTWDSIKSKSRVLSLKNLVDRFFTFDHLDAGKYGLMFLPLFYLDQYKSNEYDLQNYKYDLCFIGTAHSDRYHIIRQLMEICEPLGIQFYVFLYSPSKLLFYIKNIVHTFFQRYKKIDRAFISFESLSKEEVIAIFNTSKVILDIEHPKQSGLTIRVFEALAKRKKILTTSRDITSYDFYNPSIVCFLDRNNIALPIDFLKSDYKINECIFEKYSIGEWLKKIFQ